MTARTCLTAVLAAALATAAPADDPKPDAPKPVAAQAADIRKGVDDALKTVMAAQKAVQAADADAKADKQAEFQTAMQAYQTAQRAAGTKFLALVKGNKADPAVLDVLPQALQAASPADRKTLYAVVKENHLASPKLTGFVQFLSRDDSPDAAGLLKEIAAAATDDKVKGAATLAVGLSLKSQLTGYSAKPTAEQVAKVLPEAEKYLTTAAAEFGDQKYGRGTIRTTAEKELVGLRNVPNLIVGKAAPEAAAAALDGKPATLSALKGKVVVLDIWATWCPPCRAMIPHEREMVKKLEGKPFVLVSVSADDKKETLTTFLEKEPMPWTHWWNGSEGGILSGWNVSAFPTIYVIDAKGVIRHKNLRGEALEKAVEELVKEAEAAKGGA